MTTRFYTGILFALVCVYAAAAQESPTPSPIAAQSPTLSSSPEESVAPALAPEQTPSPNAFGARSVRISFVPPPMEGTISLAIYDKNDKLVRVLHQEAKLNEFAIGADALVTQWDGKNDDEEDLPAGRYHARGYLVGPLKIEDLGQNPRSASDNNAGRNVKVRLVPNPLRNDRRSIVDIGVGFDNDGSYLKTSNDLPLLTVSETPNLIRAGITKKGENAVDVWQDDGTTLRQFRISNIDKMMAFDCGEFELK